MYPKNGNEKWKRLEPLGENIVIRRDPKDEMVGNIVLTDQTKDSQRVSSGKVVKIGPDVPAEAGLEIGMRVYIPKYAGSDLFIYSDDKLTQEDELAVLKYDNVIVKELPA